MSRLHGQYKTRLYKIWKGIKRRCSSPTYSGYKNYGGRGITLCAEWAESFEAFRDWAIANNYRDGLSIDRINNDANYEPGNCRWATAAEQLRNTRRSRVIAAFGQSKVVEDWAKDGRCKVPLTTLVGRLNSGWEPEIAISQPPSVLCSTCKTPLLTAVERGTSGKCEGCKRTTRREHAERRRRREGRTRHRRPCPPDLITRIMDRRSAGASYSALVKEFDRSLGTIAGIVRKHSH